MSFIKDPNFKPTIRLYKNRYRKTNNKIAKIINNVLFQNNIAGNVDKEQSNQRKGDVTGLDDPGSPL